MEKGRFLYGESMGGAVTLLLHKKDPSFWNGAILVAPMCKVKKNPQFLDYRVLGDNVEMMICCYV